MPVIRQRTERDRSGEILGSAIGNLGRRLIGTSKDRREMAEERRERKKEYQTNVELMNVVSDAVEASPELAAAFGDPSNMSPNDIRARFTAVAETELLRKALIDNQGGRIANRSGRIANLGAIATNERAAQEFENLQRNRAALQTAVNPPLVLRPDILREGEDQRFVRFGGNDEDTIEKLRRNKDRIETREEAARQFDIEFEAEQAENVRKINVDLQDRALDMLGELNAEPEIKKLRGILGGAAKVEGLLSKPNPTPSDDMVGLFAMMTAIDPTSSVREGEVATARNTTGVPGRLLNAYNKARKGSLLNPEQRAAFIDSARTLVEEQKEVARPMLGQFDKLARAAGFAMGSVLDSQMRQILDSVKKDSSTRPTVRFDMSSGLPVLTFEQARDNPHIKRFIDDETGAEWER